MSRTIVIYSSKYGSTEKYAKQIAQTLGCAECPLESFDWNELKQYDVVVYGGGIYAGKIRGLKEIKRVWKQLESKRVAIFADGQMVDSATPPDQLKAANFSPEMANTPLFLMKGQIAMEKLKGIDKLVIGMIAGKKKKQAVIKINQEGRQEKKPGPEEIIPLVERVKKWI